MTSLVFAHILSLNLQDAGVTDQSGLHLTYTTARRPNDVQSLTLGVPVTEDWKIPPGKAFHRVEAICPGGCTGKRLSQEVKASAADDCFCLSCL